MSYELHVYCVEPLEPSALAGVVAGIEGLRLRPDEAGRPQAAVVERAVGGKHEHLATIDGPLRVEAEVLPDAVRAAAVGIGVTYQVHCAVTPAIGVRLTNELARGMAREGRGVVYDPQDMEAPVSAAYAALTDGATGYLVERRGVHVDTAWAAGDLVRVIPVEVANANPAPPEDDNELQARIAFTVIGEVQKDVAVAA